MALDPVLSLADVADVGARWGDTDLYRAAIGALDEAMAADRSSAQAWLDDEPPLTGNAHADALVAAVAEHIAFHRDLAVPAWVYDERRILAAVWYPVDLPSIRTRAIVSSPASFARRLIYIDRIDLARV